MTDKIKNNIIEIFKSIITILLVIAVAYILIYTRHSKTLEPIVSEARTVEVNCKHQWKILDNIEHSTLITCNKCGKLAIVDFNNNKIKYN